MKKLVFSGPTLICTGVQDTLSLVSVGTRSIRVANSLDASCFLSPWICRNHCHKLGGDS